MMCKKGLFGYDDYDGLREINNFGWLVNVCIMKFKIV